MALSLACVAGCRDSNSPTTVTLWHQMVPAEREMLEEEIAGFEALHPGVRIASLYKETEELRSGFQAAALAGTGPELIFGPSDVIGPYQTMGIVRDMSRWFPAEVASEFRADSLIYLPSPSEPSRRELLQVGDRIGNHLALVYNRNYVPHPPATTEQLIRLAEQNTLDSDGDGTFERYGLVWNSTEPFFAVPFLGGFGGRLFDPADSTSPALDTAQVIAGLELIRLLRDRYRVIPENCDYELADSLFKNGEAAMIINGDWSWSDYLSREELNAAVAPLPVVVETGKPMAPMVASKGYSLNVHAQDEALEAAMRFVQYMTSSDVQRRFMARLRTLPSRRALFDDPLLKQDPTLVASAEQARNGQPMPVVAELRAVWDSMRPHYQALLGGSLTAAEAAAAMQRDALQNIERMNRGDEPGRAAVIVQVAALVLLAGLLVRQRRHLRQFVAQWSDNRFAYVCAAPALLIILMTVVFPFAYNVLLSFSNMSLTRFQNWKITGFDNYVEVFSDLGPTGFWSVMLKTVLWTAVNLSFHVGIGLLLAVALNGPVRAKSVYRVLLILPWAVPAYITALTWRGMFDFKYGAVNLLIGKYLHLEPINWLGSPLEAFLACVLTNVWLGFPFMMVIALGGMQGIPEQMYEAARVDGVSRLGQFLHITLPMLRPVLLPAVTLGAIWTFNNLNVIWLVSNGGEPSDKTHILVSYVYKAVFNLYRYGYGAALSMVIFFMLLAFSLLFLQKTQATEGI